VGIHTPSNEAGPVSAADIIVAEPVSRQTDTAAPRRQTNREAITIVTVLTRLFDTVDFSFP